MHKKKFICICTGCTNTYGSVIGHDRIGARLELISKKCINTILHVLIWFKNNAIYN